MLALAEMRRQIGQEIGGLVAEIGCRRRIDNLTIRKLETRDQRTIQLGTDQAGTVIADDRGSDLADQVADGEVRQAAAILADDGRAIRADNARAVIADDARAIIAYDACSVIRDDAQDVEIAGVAFDGDRIEGVVR